MREGTDLEFDLHVNLMTWVLGLVCLWRVLELGTHLRWTLTDWLVALLVVLYVGCLEVLRARRRAVPADDWH